MLTFNVYSVDEGGFGFLVEAADGSFRLAADSLPGAEGVVRMTEAEATAYAQAVISENTPAG